MKPPLTDHAGANHAVRPSLVIRLGGLRAVAVFVAVVGVGVALIVCAPLAAVWPFGKSHHPTVEVQDEAGVFQEDALAASLRELTFRQDVHVAVLSLPGYDIDNLNAEVLDYARTHDTDTPWISQKNPSYWSDGLIILAVAPDSRWVGCYFGEDVKLDLDQQQAIQDAARDQLRAADWAGAMTTMGDDVADRIGRPGGDSTATAVATLLLATGGVALVVTYLHLGVLARRRTAAARRSYAQVAHDYEAIELAAETVPASDPYGAQVLARYRWFRWEYDDVTRLFREHGEPVGAQWFGWQVLRRATRLQERSAELDALDDVIANAAALLTMGHGWEEAWRNEQGPVLEDLESLRDLCDQVAQQGVGLGARVDREWSRVQHLRLESMTTALAQTRMTPSDALAELDRMSGEIHARAGALARTALDADTSRHASERRRRFERSRGSKPAVYRGIWELDDGAHGTYSPHSTVRLNPSSPALRTSGSWGGGSASVSSGPGGPGGLASSFAPVSDLVVGYSSAASYTPSSGGGSGASGFSGGGSGGGGFSGAGSSSRF